MEISQPQKEMSIVLVDIQALDIDSRYRAFDNIEKKHIL